MLKHLKTCGQTRKHCLASFVASCETNSVSATMFSEVDKQRNMIGNIMFPQQRLLVSPELYTQQDIFFSCANLQNFLPFLKNLKVVNVFNCVFSFYRFCILNTIVYN